MIKEIKNERKNILVVEDNVPSKNLINAFFKNESNYTLHFANSVSVAKEVLEFGSIDGILLDIALSGRQSLDGLDLAKFVRNHDTYKNIPIIATTAYALMGDKEKFIEGGCTDYLAKPLGRQDLMNMVKKYIF